MPSLRQNLKQLGEDVSEQLEFVPANFRVIRHVRPTLACGCCTAIVQAPAPSRPIKRGIVGPGLLAHVLVAKFADMTRRCRCLRLAMEKPKPGASEPMCATTVRPAT